MMAAEADTTERDLRYPEPVNGTRDEWVKSSLKSRRSLGRVRVNTRQVTRVGLAVSEWLCRLIDIEIQRRELPFQIARVLELYYLTERICSGSGQIIGRGVKAIHCPVCRFHEPISVDRRGLLVEHGLPYTNEDVALELHISTRTVMRHKKAGIAVIKARLLPVGMEEGEDDHEQ